MCHFVADNKIIRKVNKISNPDCYEFINLYKARPGTRYCKKCAIWGQFPPSHRKAAEKHQLQGKNRGHTPHKIPVAGLMAENLHSQNCSHAAARQGSSKQGFFRDTPTALSRTALISAHHNKRCHVHYGQVNT